MMPRCWLRRLLLRHEYLIIVERNSARRERTLRNSGARPKEHKVSDFVIREAGVHVHVKFCSRFAGAPHGRWLRDDVVKKGGDTLDPFAGVELPDANHSIAFEGLDLLVRERLNGLVILDHRSLLVRVRA